MNFYLLDLDFSLRLAAVCPRGDPLAHLYHADSPVDRLPDALERLVRELAARPEPESCVVEGLTVTVTRLRGPAGDGLGVFVSPRGPN